MQGWTLFFHNFKWQPSLIYDEAYFWHNDETHNTPCPFPLLLFINKEETYDWCCLENIFYYSNWRLFPFSKCSQKMFQFFLMKILIQMLLKKCETNVCMMFTLRLLNGAMSWGSVQYAGYFCFPIFA
jgi:hypothetical protein